MMVAALTLVKHPVFGQVRALSRNNDMVLGRPNIFLNLQRQWALKPARCQRSTVSGCNRLDHLQQAGQSRTSHTPTPGHHHAIAIVLRDFRKATFS
jgi:hypothetical protein